MRESSERKLNVAEIGIRLAWAAIITGCSSGIPDTVIREIEGAVNPNPESKVPVPEDTSVEDLLPTPTPPDQIDPLEMPSVTPAQLAPPTSEAKQIEKEMESYHEDIRNFADKFNLLVKKTIKAQEYEVIDFVDSEKKTLESLKDGKNLLMKKVCSFQRT